MNDPSAPIDVAPLFEPIAIRGLASPEPHRDGADDAQLLSAAACRARTSPPITVAARKEAPACIITEGVGIDHPGALGEAGLGEATCRTCTASAALAGWKRVVDAVHAAGGVIFRSSGIWA